jgi:hypothetical protein
MTADSGIKDKASFLRKPRLPGVDHEIQQLV